MRRTSLAWPLRFSWRDSRGSRGRLALVMLSVSVGVGTLVATASLKEAMDAALRDQSKNLLGADVVVNSHQPFSADDHAFFAHAGGTQNEENRFNSMLSVPALNTSRLVQVRAVDGPFPLYGQVITDPPEAATLFQKKQEVLVEQSLALQYHLAPGSQIRLGALDLRVAGVLKKVSGESMNSSLFAPRLYISADPLKKTDLLKTGSLTRFRRSFRFSSETDAAAFQKKATALAPKRRWDIDTVTEREKALGGATENLARFLNLVGFGMLLLGAFGVASGIHAHAQSKRDGAATLRCLGITGAQLFGIYLVQALVLGLLGSAVGTGLGLLIQALVPHVLADFLPFALPFVFSGGAVAQGFGVGMAVSLLFSLPALLLLRRVPPLQALRAGLDVAEKGLSKKERAALTVMAGALLFLFAWIKTHHWKQSALFAAGSAGGMLVLVGVATLLLAALRRHTPERWPYEMRQGIANLFRPNNQTALLVATLGLGTALLVALSGVQHALIAQLLPLEDKTQSNLAFFDVQTDQRQDLWELLKSHGLAPTPPVPIVAMRLTRLAGRTVEERAKETPPIPTWALHHEYRSTYRDTSVKSETTLAGEWPPASRPANGVVPISVENELTKTLRVALHDHLVFDVLGVPLETEITHIRNVNWYTLAPNFFVVFPSGVLEDAPQFFVISVRTTTPEQSSAVQADALRRFPTISAIDLSLVLDTLQSFLSKISFALRFVTLFALTTGLLVLISSVVSAQKQRLFEMALLRTLGASRPQLQRIVFCEFFVLGATAATFGAGLGVAATWALCRWTFHVAFAFPWLATLAVALLIVAVTLLTALLFSRSAWNAAPSASLAEA